MQMTGGIM